MRIGIDARLYRETGVGRYLRNLISELSVLDNRNEYNIYLSRKEFPGFKSPGSNFHKKLLDVPWHSFREQFITPIVLLKDRVDIMHFPYFNVPVFYPHKYILTIHDLIIDHFDTGRASTLPFYLYKIKRFAYKFIVTRSIRMAVQILVISQTTKKEVLDHYGVHPEKITVTYDSLDNNFKNCFSSSGNKNMIGDDYLLYVGNAYPHKNLERLIEAFKIVRSKKKVKLVLAGDDPFFYKRLKDSLIKADIGREIIFFGMANDSDLVNLYTRAKLLVIPSLMEGFGLPNLEAVYSGLMPVVSDIPVFKEIWGNSLLIFDPESVDDMADKILKGLCMRGEDKIKIITETRKRIDKFKWEVTARMTLDIYEKAGKTG